MEINLKENELEELKKIDDTINSIMIDVAKNELEYEKKKRVLYNLLNNISNKADSELKKIAEKYNFSKKNIVNIDYKNNKIILRDLK